MSNAIQIVSLISTLISGVPNNRDFDQKLPDPIPYINLIVNKNICLYADVYRHNIFDNNMYIRPYKEYIKNIESELDGHHDEFFEFLIDYSNNDVHNRFMTKQFIDTYKTAIKEYDKFFYKNIDRLYDRAIDLQLFIQKKLSDHFFKNVYIFYNIEKKFKFDHKFNTFFYVSHSESAELPIFLNNETIMMKNMEIPTIQQTILLLKTICHIFYKYRDQKFQDMTFSFFKRHKSKYAMAGYLILDDLLSTTISMRWAYNKITKKHIKKAHNSKYIDKLSKDILPIVSDYIDNKKSFDMHDEFFEKYLQILSKSCPDICDDLTIILGYATISSPDKNTYNFIKNFINEKCNIKDEYIVSIYDRFDIHRTIISVGNTVKNQYTSDITFKIPETNKDFLFITKDMNSRYYIIINTIDQNKIRKAFNIIFQKKIFHSDFFTYL